MKSYLGGEAEIFPACEESLSIIPCVSLVQTFHQWILTWVGRLRFFQRVKKKASAFIPVSHWSNYSTNEILPGWGGWDFPSVWKKPRRSSLCLIGPNIPPIKSYLGWEAEIFPACEKSLGVNPSVSLVQTFHQWNLTWVGRLRFFQRVKKASAFISVGSINLFTDIGRAMLI